MDRGISVGYSPWGHKELDTTEQLLSSLFAENDGQPLGTSRVSLNGERRFLQPVKAEFKF